MAIRYVRVKDPDTGHEFDIPANHPHIRRGLVAPVKTWAYPASDVMRPPKHHLDLAAVPSAAQKKQPATRSRTAAPKENSHG